MLEAYRVGLFPMADPRGRISWYDADPRAIIELDRLHVPRSLARTMRRGIYEVRVDTRFHEVIAGCARRPSTWISRRLIGACTILHERGLAHSVEAFRDGILSGGLYGIALGGAFFGESMYAEAPDASKVCTVALVERLRERRFALLDCQTRTSHTARLGATLISRREYLQRLEQALAVDCRFAP
jgi:leucyl/phenylalanyl-tRNA--protein transferase